MGPAPRWTAALGTSNVHKLGKTRQRRAALLSDFDVIRQENRKLLLGDRHHAALSAVQHGDRRAPVALAGAPPVLEPASNPGLAKAALFASSRHLFHGRLIR